MAERSEMDRERLGRIYQRMAHLPNVDANVPDAIIIQLDKECEHYRKRTEYWEARTKELYAKLDEAQEKTATIEAVQDNTSVEIIKALAENGFDTITINAYKSKEE